MATHARLPGHSPASPLKPSCCKGSYPGITFLLADTILVDGKKLYEFLAVTKVDGLPPAPSRSRARVVVRGDVQLPEISVAAACPSLQRVSGARLLTFLLTPWARHLEGPNPESARAKRVSTLLVRVGSAAQRRLARSLTRPQARFTRA